MKVLWIAHSAARKQRAVLLMALVLVTASCGPSDVGKRALKPVTVGMTTDSVIALLGDGPLVPADAIDSVMLQHGYRTQRYLKNGMNFVVLYYRVDPGAPQDRITRETQTPILFHEDTVLGWGWNYYLKAAAKIGLPNPLEPQAGEQIDKMPG